MTTRTQLPIVHAKIQRAIAALLEWLKSRTVITRNAFMNYGAKCTSISERDINPFASGNRKMLEHGNLSSKLERHVSFHSIALRLIEIGTILGKKDQAKHVFFVLDQETHVNSYEDARANWNERFDAVLSDVKAGEFIDCGFRSDINVDTQLLISKAENCLEFLPTEYANSEGSARDNFYRKFSTITSAASFVGVHVRTISRWIDEQNETAWMADGFVVVSLIHPKVADHLRKKNAKSH